MYTHPQGSYVVSLAANLTGQSVVSGHLDGSIWKFTFPADENVGGLGHSQVCTHSCVPYALGWGNAIAAAGNDNRVVFYDQGGREIQAFDYSNDDSVREFCSCAFNPSGDTVVFGTYNRFYIYSFSSNPTEKERPWQEVGFKQVDFMYNVTALSWKPDGSKLCVGSMTGAVDMYDCCVKQCTYKGKFEFTYVSKSSVIVKELKSGKRIVLK
jgi:intraflagellar transport protein 172